MAEDKKISQLNSASAFTGAEKFELVQGGLNVAGTPEQMKTYIGGITREFDRAFSETIVFDKNEIFYEQYVATGNLTFEIGSGNLVDQPSGARMVVTLDGTQSLNFGAGFDYLYGITNGEVKEAGTYEIYFLYTNGHAVVNFPGVSSQSSGATVLSTPANFAAVADGETAIDLSWDDVSNESSYLIEFSLTGTGGWSTLDTPAADATTSTQTGLSAGNTRYYRIKAIGDGVNFLDSAFSTVISGQTESSGDVTDPVPTFLPADSATDWPINKPLRITWDEPVRNADGSEITNANVASRLRVKQTNVSGSDISVTATVDGTKQIFDIVPVTHFGENQVVYWDVNNVEDVNGNDITAAISATFTTSDFTFFNGTSNRLVFGDILDSLFAAVDTNFWLELTINDILLTGSHPFVAKYDTSGNQRSFQWYHIGSDVYFGWVAQVNGIGNRLIKWTNVLTAGEHDIQVRVDMSIDTNDGLDRVSLYIDTVLQGSKTLQTTTGTLTASIANGTAQLAIGAYINNAGTPIGSNFLSGEAKDFIVRSTGGTVVEINVPNLVTGLDTSGNARHGTWV